ncbi:hypothetical protein HPB49_003257 [Dermacentor silvarum]|uniref:Uncharacterized protein n=1 Tax=Dermacentor silvarum TaxID=543639 RepID=A0ACB8C003_DERSI|nr:hypothetical protein HPB49_003257 [Dermacentor silvarum]
MAAESEEGCQSKERTTWTDEETRTLINIWEDVLPDLRGAKRNLKVYMTIAQRLRAAGIRKSTKEVKKKIQNMGNKYRLLTRTGTEAGPGGRPWRFYWDLHRFLGSLPANDASLMEESGCSFIDGASPEKRSKGAAHGGVSSPKKYRQIRCFLKQAQNLAMSKPPHWSPLLKRTCSPKYTNSCGEEKSGCSQQSYWLNC